MTLHALSNYSSPTFDDTTRDLRGLDIHFQDSEETARVSDLFIDDQGSVRYLVATLDGEHHVLPIGYVRFLPETHALAARGVTADDLRQSPLCDPEANVLDEADEDRVTAYYDSVDEADRTYAGPAYRGSGWQTGEDREVDLVERLDEIEVAEYSEDPSGWTVIGEDGRELGKVEHLVGDTSSMKVTHLVVQLDSRLFDQDRSVLLPVGYADLVRDERDVQLRGIDIDTAATLPPYSDEALREGDLIARTRDALRRRGATEGARYASPRYSDEAMSSHERDIRVQRAEEELLIGKRARRGEVRVEKHVETERVGEEVELRDDTVTVERQPASAAEEAAQIGEEEVRVPIVKEEAVVTKRPVVKEVIVVKRNRGTRIERIAEDVRRERVEVETEGEAAEEEHPHHPGHHG